MNRRATPASCAVVLVLCLAPVGAGQARQQANPMALALGHFQDRVKEYIKLREGAQSVLPAQKVTKEPADIETRQLALARAVRQARPNARAGDIFIPEAAPFLRRLIADDFKRRSIGQKRAAMKEVPALRLRPNDDYPANQPLATVPPKLLDRLPRLPDGLEFRFVGNTLILRDSNTNLVVDVLDNALPRQ